MIIDMPDTTISNVAKALVRTRQEGGVVALGRVLTLIIVLSPGTEEDIIEAANDASREHPMRVIVLLSDPHGAGADNPPRLDAQIRVGGDAGASEVIVLRADGAAGNNSESLVTGLLLPDAPVVAWWPRATGRKRPSQSSIGRIAHRRITDAAAQPDPTGWVAGLGEHYTPGDTDLAWTRLTHWREQLAAVLDQPPYEPVTAIEIAGASDSPSTALLAAWLRLTLDAPVTWHYLTQADWSTGIKSVRLVRAGGDTLLERITPEKAVLHQPGQPSHELAFPRRTLRDCLAEELRSLDPDLLYGRVIKEGWSLLTDDEGHHG